MIGDTYVRDGIPERPTDPPLFPDPPTQMHLVATAKDAYSQWRWLSIRRATGEEGLDAQVTRASGFLCDAQEDLKACGLWIDTDGQIVDYPKEQWA